MVDVAEVFIWGEQVGAVQWDEASKLAYFEYAPSFRENGWELSPIMMPMTRANSVYSFPGLREPKFQDYHAFHGLPGLLADALPDKYGNQLIDVWLTQQGRLPGSMNPVEKLCFIGSRAMGALEFLPSHTRISKNTFRVEIDSLVDIAQKMLSQREKFTANIIEEQEHAVSQILKIGTSAGGARPKAVIAFDPKRGEVRSGQTNTPKGFEHWLIKLDGVVDEEWTESSGWGRVEYAYYLMAKDAGIQIMESRLLEEHNRAHFMTRRFDRLEDGTRHHFQTWCGLMHYDFNEMFAYSYEQLFQTMRRLKLSYPEAREMFRRMVFNIFALNRDDHTKNFSFLMKKDGPWQLAPAYDLCYSYDESNYWVQQHTLSVQGKREHISFEDLLAFADEIGIKKADLIIEQVQSVVGSWESYADEANVPKKLQQRIASNIDRVLTGKL